MTTYNGWANYETWAVGLYLDGNYDSEGTYRYVRDLSEQHAAGHVSHLADALRDLVDEHTRGSQDHIASGLASDLLSAALDSVDWRELAEHLRAETWEGWTDEARQRGRDDARAAASWTTDGNTEHATAARVLQMAEDGDPALDDYLPRRPSLSGEWADDPTPDTLTEEITSTDASEIDPDLIDQLAATYEDSVAETFEDACMAELRALVFDGLIEPCSICGALSCVRHQSEREPQR